MNKVQLSRSAWGAWIEMTGIILCLLVLLPGVAGAEGLTVAVAPETVLSGPDITLGEVAVISGGDAERIESLSRLRIGNAPFAGQSIVLSMDTFGARLLNKGVDLSDINWQVPPYIKITAASQILSGDKIAAEAKNFLSNLFREKSPENLTITQLAKQPDLILPPGEITLKAYIPQGIRTGGAASVDVGISVDGQLKASAKIRFQVTLFEEVAVTAKPISAGSILTLDNLRLERRNVAKNSSSLEYITDLDKVLGLAVRRSLGAGLVLDSSSLVKPNIIKRSQEVTVVARKGAIEITAAGVAMQDGYEGQVIRVRNKITKKIIAAKVIDADTVKILIHGGK